MERHQSITACAVIVKGQKAFIAKRAATKKFLPNKFEIPGGHVEFGEAPEEALKRELIEEMGLKIEVLMPFHAFAYLTDNGNDHCIEIDYLAKIKPEDQRITLRPEEHSEFRWISEAEIPDYLQNNDPEAAAIRKGLELMRKMK